MSTRPDWLDERIRLQEIPAHLADQAQARIAEPGYQLTQEALSASNAQILSELPPERFAAEVRRRALGAERVERARRPSKRWRGWGSMVLVSAIALFFLMVPKPEQAPAVAEARPGTPASAAVLPTAPSAVSAPTVVPTVAPTVATDPGWRSKGDADLVVQRQSPSGLLPVSALDTLVAGTRLQLSIARKLEWAAVLSLDSRGQLAQHWPLTGDSARALPQGALPRTWELDDAPGQETFVLVSASGPFGLQALRKAMFLHRATKLGSKYKVSVVKVRRPGSAP